MEVKVANVSIKIHSVTVYPGRSSRSHGPRLDVGYLGGGPGKRGSERVPNTVEVRTQSLKRDRNVSNKQKKQVLLLFAKKSMKPTLTSVE